MNAWCSVEVSHGYCVSRPLLHFYLYRYSCVVDREDGVVWAVDNFGLGVSVVCALGE